jgi:GntR family transcriptional regulator
VTGNRITRESPVPLYRQLKALIARDIAEGALAPNDPVGPESELSRRHNVSRITVRQALGELQQEGLITRIVGKGTFVTDRPQAGRLTRLAGFAEEMRALGLTPRYHTFSVESRTAPSHVLEAFGLSQHAKVVTIERLLLADDEPVASAQSYLPEELFRGSAVTLDERMLDERSLYSLLEEASGVVLHRATEEVAPQRAGPFEADRLGIEEGALLLHVHRRVFDTRGRVCEVVDLRYVADRYSYRVELSR